MSPAKLGVHDLKKALFDARGDRTRREIADLATEIEGSHPDFSERDIANFEHHIRTPPTDGLKLRTHLAAVGITLTSGLRLIGNGYWPGLATAAAGGSSLEEIKALCLSRGLKPPVFDPGSRRVVIQL